MHDRNNLQSTFFGYPITTRRLNLANTIFLLLNYFTLNRPLFSIHPEDASFTEVVQVFFILLSILAYTGINDMKEIVDCVKYLLVDEDYNSVFISKTLKNCISRGKRIEDKLNQLSMDKQIKAQDNFICPYSHVIMKCPVMATDGHIYDYENIKIILHNTRVSPFTGESLANVLIPLIELQDQIETWVTNQIDFEPQNQLRL